MAGLSLQPGPKSEGAAKVDRGLLRATKPAAGSETQDVLPGCQRLADELGEFLDTLVTPPDSCFSAPHAPKPDSKYAELVGRSEGLKLVVATVPDPVHTHFATNFDQLAAAIQEAAQDEQYDFDRSWLPWEDESSSYALLSDEKTFNREKLLKENQPGIILFRKTCRKEEAATCAKVTTGLSGSYRDGLVVFVVGE